MVAIKSDTAICRCRAISFNLLQNACSRLTLVSRPPIAIERLTTRDLMNLIPHNANGNLPQRYSFQRCANLKKIFGVAKTPRLETQPRSARGRGFLFLHLSYSDQEPPCRRDVECLRGFRDGGLLVRRLNGAEKLAEVVDAPLGHHSTPGIASTFSESSTEQDIVLSRLGIPVHIDTSGYSIFVE